jgi:diguanylate cyclase (GGDEF)-like protein
MKRIPAERRKQALAYRRQHVSRFLEARSLAFWALFGLALTLLVGWADLLSGYEYAFSLFYLAPVSLVGWYAGRRVAIPMAVLCGLMWIAADALARQTYPDASVVFWNTVVRTSVFLIVGLLTADLRGAVLAERRLSRTDGLTGAINSRHFMDLLELELERSRRFKRPFSLAYIDLDNFKSVNDSQGHSSGDRVLQAVAASIQGCLRRTDTLARMGGDEFIILFSETSNGEMAEILERIRSAAIAAMRENSWPVTLSIGAVTFAQPPSSAEKAVTLADQQMYTAKNTGKDRVLLAIHPSGTG